MKYDILEDFKEKLQGELTPNTAKKYYSSVNKLLKCIDFNSVEEIPADYIAKELKTRFKTKNEVSAAKCGIMLLKRYYPALNVPDSEEYKEIRGAKRNYSTKPAKTLSLKETNAEINRIENPKLQLAYRLILDSGLRISEAAALTRDNIRFKEGLLEIEVEQGKGGKYGVIKCIENPKLYCELQQYVAENKENTLFYSEVYMREKAYEAGFEPHDLRRIFAQRRREMLKQSMPVYEANAQVQEDLRHTRFSTTKRYLFNRKLKFDNFSEEPKEVDGGK